MKNKVIALFLLLSGLWSILIIRSAYLQILPNERLSHLEERQFQTVVTLPSRRGNIIDINGKDLAMSAPAYSIYADPQIIQNKRQLAKDLSRELDLPYSKVMSKIKDSSKRFVWIERLVPSDIATKLKEKKIRGLGFVEESKRVYPNDYMLSTVLGFVGKEGSGLEGVELAYDKELKGEDRKISMRKDAKGRPLIQDGTLFKESPQGKEIQLTIDSDLQYFVETELAQAMKKHEADAIYAVVLDAKTSAIRALASMPHYDLNNPGKFSSQQRRNRAVSDTFEPGSTMKTFVLAEALEKKLYKPESKIFCENGYYKIGKRVIREAEQSHSQGLISLTEVLAYSSNIGTSKVALAMNRSDLLDGLKKFGFGSKTEVDLPGEAKGIIVPFPWSDHLAANVSFGQGITTTPLQMANAYAVIANGGLLNTPYIVESITDLELNKKEDIGERKSKRVLSEKVASQMRQMLVAVTTGKGTGLSARVPGYVVAGKTGTAQKVNPNGRGYLKGGYIGSFAGFIPANDPQYVIYIAVDHPRKGYYGSVNAAPLFSTIASYIVRKEGISPDGSKEQNNLSDHSLLTKNTKTSKPTSQDLERFSVEQITASTNLLTSAPDVIDMSLREVLKKVADQDIKVKVIGSGKVYQSSPAPGESLTEDRTMTIFLKEDPDSL